MYGADVGQLKDLASAFESAAERLDSGRVCVGRRIDLRAWRGPVADRFRGSWQSQYARLLQTAADQLRSAGRDLRANAGEQEQASAATGVSGGSSAVVSPSVCIDASRDPEVTISDSAHGSETRLREKWGDSYGGKWTTEERTRGGVQVDPHVEGGYNSEKGRLEGELGVDAQYGFEYEKSAAYQNGIVSGEVENHGFTGIRGEGGADGSIGIDGARGHAGASAFVGAEQTVQGSIDVGGVGGGVEAGIMGGLGGEASADVSVSADEVKLEVKLGISLGVGVSLKPSISIKPKEIMHNLFGFMGF